MRKLFAVLAGLMLVSMSAYARDVDVGTIQMSGATYARYENSTIEIDAGGESDVWQLEFNLAGTYYVVRNFGLGAYLTYGQSGLEDAEIKSYTVGPMALYNYSLNETTSLFAKAGVGLLKVDTTTVTMDGWEYMVGGGIRYFLTPTISLDTGVVYNRQEWDSEGGLPGRTDSQIAVEAGLSVFFGGE